MRRPGSARCFSVRSPETGADLEQLERDKAAGDAAGRQEKAEMKLGSATEFASATEKRWAKKHGP